MTHPKRSNSPATGFAVALLDEFVRLGVRDIVLSPGSRSQALALAAAALESAGRIRLRVRIDERAAGFLALGLAIETGTPVLVVTTSGTAVANLHPAVLEAHHSSVPVIVLSADRPEELRGIASNQTTHQPGIFGSAVRLALDVDAPVGDGDDGAAEVAREAMAAALGPVHVNLAFRDPLSGALPVGSEPDAALFVAPAAPVREPLVLTPAPGTVVVAGSGAGARAAEVARALGAPLLAEVASGAHFGPNLVVDYRTLIEAANFGDRVERVVVFGHPTLSREIPALIQREGVTTIVVRHGSAEDYNPGHAVDTFADDLLVEGEPENTAAARSWLGRWVMTSRANLEQHDAPAIGIAISNEPADQAAFNRAVLAGLRAPVTRRALAEAAWRMTWPHDRLVLGASRLIREVDRHAPGKKITVHANRGLAGIDGTISTGVGIALASQDEGGAAAGGVTRVLLGDLALLHDVGSLLFGLGETRPRIQVIVGNDGGGTIFDGLEVASIAEPGAFDRVLYTGHDVSLEQLAAAYGWSYRRVANRGELDAALTPTEGPTLIEVPIAR
jgi:2-succinyl-5-enolpyruvyl-6-hydroxy-3-cyclohexene-1-carboxylate synthase